MAVMENIPQRLFPSVRHNRVVQLAKSSIIRTTTTVFLPSVLLSTETMPSFFALGNSNTERALNSREMTKDAQTVKRVSNVLISKEKPIAKRKNTMTHITENAPM